MPNEIQRTELLSGSAGRPCGEIWLCESQFERTKTSCIHCRVRVAEALHSELEIALEQLTALPVKFIPCTNSSVWEWQGALQMVPNIQR